MKILCDVDGVLADFTATYLRILHLFTGRTHTREQVTCFDFAKCVASKDEDEKVWRYIDLMPGLVRDIEESCDVRYILRGMDHYGEVKIVTSPHLGPTWMPERAQWLTQRGVKKRDIVFASDKALIHGDVLIDDSIDNVNAWQLAHPASTAILLSQPWNRGAKCAGAIACGWGEVFELLTDLSARKAA